MSRATITWDSAPGSDGTDGKQVDSRSKLRQTETEGRHWCQSCVCCAGFVRRNSRSELKAKAKQLSESMKKSIINRENLVPNIYQ